MFFLIYSYCSFVCPIVRTREGEKVVIIWKTAQNEHWITKRWENFICTCIWSWPMSEYLPQVFKASCEVIASIFYYIFSMQWSLSILGAHWWLDIYLGGTNLKSTLSMSQPWADHLWWFTPSCWTNMIRKWLLESCTTMKNNVVHSTTCHLEERRGAWLALKAINQSNLQFKETMNFIRLS